MAKALREIGTQGAFHFSATKVAEKERQENEERHRAAVVGSSVLDPPSVPPLERQGREPVPSVAPPLEKRLLPSALQEDDEDCPVVVELPEQTLPIAPAAKPCTKQKQSWRTLRKPKAPPK